MRTILVAIFILAAGVAQAEPHVRDGWLFGLSLGGGPGSLTEKASGDVETQGGFTWGVRWAPVVSPRAMFHVEIHQWQHTSRAGNTGLEFNFWNYAAAATFFPGDPAARMGGLWLRAGVGLNNIDAKLLSRNTTTASITEKGWSLLAAVGYEVRVKKSLALGISTGYDYLFMDSDLVETAWFVPITVDANWYF